MIIWSCWILDRMHRMHALTHTGRNFLYVRVYLSMVSYVCIYSFIFFFRCQLAVKKLCSFYRLMALLSMQGPGPFYGVTTYSTEFPRRQLPRLYRHQPDKYHAPVGLMNTVPLYRDSYVAHCASASRSCRPPPVLPVNAPLSESTEQRDNYVGEAVRVCPAIPLLQRVPGCTAPSTFEGPAGRKNWGLGRYRYSDRDDAGHEWYTFEECYLPAPEDIVYDASRYVRSDTLEAAQKRAAAARAISWVPPLRPSALPAVAWPWHADEVVFFRSTAPFQSLHFSRCRVFFNFFTRIT